MLHWQYFNFRVGRQPQSVSIATIECHNLPLAMSRFVTWSPAVATAPEQRLKLTAGGWYIAPVPRETFWFPLAWLTA